MLGGGGFIGSHLAKRLAAQGFWVRCVDLHRPRYASSAADEFLIGDLRDPNTCALALSGGFDEVYQLAADRGASGGLSIGDSHADTVRNSVLINLNVLAACTKASVGRIFYASAAAIYSEPVDDDGDGDWETRFIERLFLSHAQSYGMVTRIARLPGVFGPEDAWNDDRAGLPAVLCRRVALAEPGSEFEIWSDGRKPRSFSHIDECLDDVERLMRSDCARPVTLKSWSWTVNQLAVMILAVAGKTLSFRKGDNRWHPTLPPPSGLAATYQWIKAQVDSGSVAWRPARPTRTLPSEPDGGHPPDTCLLERVRRAIRGRELIDWPDTDFASLLEQFDVIPLGDLSRMKDGAIYVGDLPDMIRWHARRRTSHVLITSLDENWGGFSSHVPNRSYPQGDWDERLIAGGCTREEALLYLDDPAVRAVVTPQHTALVHPAILSIPIGIHKPQALIEQVFHTDGKKTQTLLINNSGWGFRRGINDRVIANFDGSIRNTYGDSLSDYFEAVIHSRFVLCPAGMGVDSHRLWETLILGSIPIVEYSPGWDTVLDDLPALFVTNFDEVTPELLAKAYPEILSRRDHFDYRKLTKDWWAKGITSLLNPL